MTTDHPDPTVFESLNARQLTPSQVASSFVPTDRFAQLLERNHNIIIGPRGSGKTTMLKMLQLPALIDWKHPDAEELSKAVDFVAVFVPTDISWKEQWSLIDGLDIAEEKKVLVKNAIFTTHTLRAIIEAFRFMTSTSVGESDHFRHFYVDLDKEREAELSRLLSDHLSLSIKVPTLDSVELLFRRRLLSIGEFVNRSRAGDSGQVEMDFIYQNFLTAISLTIDLINGYIGTREQKWALLFDELELAPREIRRNLISDTRSTDNRILFKLSISPYSEDFEIFSDADSPSAGNDYIPINLWYSNKENARPFCTSLFEQMCRTFRLEGTTPEQVFSDSEFDLGNVLRSTGDAYAKDTRLYERFRSLKSKDKSFAEYLRRRRIDIDLIPTMTENQRASKIRKITNIVSVRDAWLRESSGKLGSKRKPSLYTGSTSLFDVTEGNPRLFIGIVGTLLRQYAIDEKTVSATRQSTAIHQASNRFQALLSTIPVDHTDGTPKIRGLNELLDLIGEYFFHKVVVQDFVADPPTSFSVDAKTPESIERALGKALNAGAIVFMQDDPGNPLLRSLRGKRFRLTYLLAPHYKLPLFASKSRDLSKILENRPDMEGPDLFNELSS